jgi:hypothetical protein
VAGFYSQKSIYEYSGFFLRSWIGHVKLVNGSQVLSNDRQFFMHIGILIIHWLKQCFGGRLQATKKGFSLGANSLITMYAEFVAS